MAELLDKLWPAFVSEITEHLDSVELLLAGNENPENIDIDQLFRGFHTIKGSCSMVGFTSMETLAHHSEDILAAIRSGAHKLTEAAVDLLLESVSYLKKQFMHARDSKINPPENTSLAERLSHFIAESAENDTTTEDLQSHLSALSQAAKLAIPSLVLALDPNAKVDQVEIGLVKLIDLAKPLGFNALASSLTHFMSSLKLAEENKQQTLISLAAEVFDDIHHIGDRHAINLSLDTGATLCRARLSTLYHDQLSQLDILLDDLRNQQEADWQVEQFMSLVALSARLSELSTLQQFNALKPIWRYSKQLVIDASRGYTLFNHTIVAELLALIALAKSYQDDAEYSRLCDDALIAFQQSVASFNNERDELQNIKKHIYSQSLLINESLVDVKIDTLHTITEALAKKQQAIEIDIDFRHEETSEKIMHAIKNIGLLVHSRTLFHDKVAGVAQRTSFCFLLLTEKSLSDIDQILAVIDKTEGCYRILGIERTDSYASSADSKKNASISRNDGNSRQQAGEPRLALDSLKVEGTVVDKLISDAGEAVILHNRQRYILKDKAYQHHLNQLAFIKDNPVVAEAIDFFTEYHEALSQQNASLKSALSGLQTSALDLRVVNIAYVFDRFHTLVRTTAKKLGKEVTLIVTGSDVKIDKAMIDVLSEPLAHVIRNSIDHGIETPEERSAREKESTGHIYLHAKEKNGTVTISIRDDGRGLDTQAIRKKSIALGLIREDEQDEKVIHASIFEPGFSTAKDLSETSGRGVGMDIVRTNIRDVGGSLLLSSEPGKGTTLQLTLPVSAALQSVVLIKNNDQIMAIPERNTVEIITLDTVDIQRINHQTIMMLRGQIVPIFHLTQLLESAPLPDIKTKIQFEIVVITNGKTLVGIIVEKVVGRSEILVREGHQALKQIPGILNASVLGDGRVVIILDTGSLARLANKQAHNSDI